jgi:photosystem II stability/assembly factor-like uncharacterized protein
VVLADGTGRGTLFNTSDRGGSWKPKLALPAGSRVLSMQVFDDRRAVLYVSVAPSEPLKHLFYVTNDAGDHWTQVVPQGLPGPTVSVSFVDLDHAWWYGSSSSTGGMSSLFHTIDGGRTWTRAVVDLPTLTQISGFAGSRVSFTRDSIGWLATITRGPEPMLYPDPFVYGTRDAGRSWERQLLPAPDQGWPMGQAIYVNPPVCFGSGTCVLAVVGSSPSGVSVVRLTWIYKSSDYGRSWTGPVTVPAQGSAVYFANPEAWWAVAPPALLATSDGGRTWSSFWPDLPPSVLVLEGIVIESPRVAWARANRIPAAPSRDHPQSTALLRTNTAGAKWSEVPLPSISG